MNILYKKPEKEDDIYKQKYKYDASLQNADVGKGQYQSSNNVDKNPQMKQTTNYGGAGGNQTYMNQLNALYDQIMNRQQFKYDLNGDLLYRQMADQYTQLGRQASMDAMGQAAALTGGYGNTYAQQVGNQAYQQYLTALNEQVPSLYQQALNAYIAEGDDLMQRYQLAAAHPGYLQAMMPSSGNGGTKATEEQQEAYQSAINAMIAGVDAAKTGMNTLDLSGITLPTTTPTTTAAPATTTTAAPTTKYTTPVTNPLTFNNYYKYKK